MSVCLVPACTELTPTPAMCSSTDVAEVDPSTSSIFCPCHGSSFRLSDGTPTSPPAITALPAYAVQLDGNDALVDTSTEVDPSARVASG